MSELTFSSHYEKRTLNQIHSFIYILLLLYSIVDMMTGLASIIGLPSPGMPYKMLLLFLITIELGSFYQNKILIPLYFFTSAAASLLVYELSPISSMTESLAMILRIETAPILYYYLFNFYSNAKEELEKIINFNFLTIILNFILGLMGFGVKSYGEDAGVGVKGLYMGGNALAVVVICLFVFYVNKCKTKNIGKWFLLFLILGLLVATKVSVLGVFVYGLYYLISSARLKKKIIYLLIIPIIVGILVFVLNQQGYFDYQLGRIEHLLKLFDGNYLSAILSGRDRDLIKHWDIYYSNLNPIEILFGQGYLNNLKIIELDFFDTLLSYGLIVFIPVCCFYFSFFNKSKYSKPIIIFNLLYLAICLTSGHIWYNTSAALFFSIINVYYRNVIKNNNLTGYVNTHHLVWNNNKYLRLFCEIK